MTCAVSTSTRGRSKSFKAFPYHSQNDKSPHIKPARASCLVAQVPSPEIFKSFLPEQELKTGKTANTPQYEIAPNYRQ
jgi:hypothetical protein